MIFFLFLNENIRCGYSLEAPRRGASNEYPQNMFSLRNKKNIGIFQLKKAPYLLLWFIAQSLSVAHLTADSGVTSLNPSLTTQLPWRLVVNNF